MNYLDLAIKYQKQAQYKQAEALYIKIISENKNNFIALSNLGVIYGSQGQWEKLIRFSKLALEIKPSHLESILNIGYALINLGRNNEAIEILSNQLNADPKNDQLYSYLGIAYKHNKDFKIAIQCLSQSLNFNPKNIISILENGQCYEMIGQTSKAIQKYHEAIEIDASNPNSYNLLGIAEQKNFEYEKALLNFQKAFDLNKENPEIISNFGSCLYLVNQKNKAISIFKKGIEVVKDKSTLYYNLAILYIQDENHQKALQYLEKIQGNLSENLNVILSKLVCKRWICEWEETYKDKLVLLHKDNQNFNPFPLSFLEDSPSKYLIKAKKYFSETYRNQSKKINLSKKNKIRLGYISSNIYEHPVSILLTRVLELHDKSKFEIYTYSFGKKKEDEYYKRIKNSSKKFYDLSTASLNNIIKQIREDKIDIAIDLMGYTKDNRHEIYTIGIAPIQISYLGYPGTIGGDSIQYMIADKFLIPNEYKKFYSEKIIYMPNTYMCNDDSIMPDNSIQINRMSENLPDDSFVFCCFNSCYKLNPEIFKAWLSLIKQVDNSVLWLYCSNEEAKENLKKQAVKYNVNSSRLIFAKKQPLKKHLSRQKCADLFLDTSLYSAGATAWIALSMGLPIITISGKSYTSRMSGSLLNALGLTELITDSIEAYKNKAYELATNKSYLNSIKDKLEKLKRNSDIFNSNTFTKQLESKYEQLIKQNLSILK
tara:strand:+ start:10010 stop:12145 length:2136 start_codon:yes stop_codon:yes gene_type:complete